MLSSIVAQPTYPSHADVLARISSLGRDDLITFLVPCDPRAAQRRKTKTLCLFGPCSGPRSHPDRVITKVDDRAARGEWRVGDIRAWFASHTTATSRMPAEYR
jgi:hypothetical protein